MDDTSFLPRGVVSGLAGVTSTGQAAFIVNSSTYAALRISAALSASRYGASVRVYGFVKVPVGLPY